MTDEKKFQRAAIVVLAALVIGFMLASGMAKRLYGSLPEGAAARENRERAAWYRYRGENCAFTGQRRTSTSYHRVGLMTFSDTATEYEWKCRLGDIHWDRDDGTQSIPAQ